MKFQNSTKFQNFYKILNFWPDLEIFTKFQTLEKNSKCWPNFTVSAKFHKFQNLRNSFNTLGGPPPPSKFDKTHWYWTSIANFWGGYHLFYVCWPFTDMSGGSVDLILILVCTPKRRHWGFIKWWAEAKATLAFVAETKLLVYNDNYNGNFDDNDDKNDQQTYNYKGFWVKIYQF